MPYIKITNYEYVANYNCKLILYIALVNTCSRYLQCKDQPYMQRITVSAN